MQQSITITADNTFLKKVIEFVKANSKEAKIAQDLPLKNEAEITADIKTRINEAKNGDNVMSFSEFKNDINNFLKGI